MLFRRGQDERIEVVERRLLWLNRTRSFPIEGGTTLEVTEREGQWWLVISGETPTETKWLEDLGVSQYEERSREVAERLAKWWPTSPADAERPS